MSFDYKVLARHISSYGWEKFSRDTNISVDYLVNNILFGKEFSLSEADAMCSILGIDEPKVLKELFFTPSVEKKQLVFSINN